MQTFDSYLNIFMFTVYYANIYCKNYQGAIIFGEL